MVETLNASQVTLAILEEKFSLNSTQEANFFTEWQFILESIASEELFVLERVKSNYNNLLKNPPVLEGLVKMVVLSPLLDLAGFYQAPFRIKLENEVQISSLDEDEHTVINGKIDVLVLRQTFWIFVIEAKMSDFSLTKALPQALSYMLGSPNHKVFGMLTNGTDFVFLKLLKETLSQYATSQVFSLLSPGNELIKVLQILKIIRQIVALEI